MRKRDESNSKKREEVFKKLYKIVFFLKKLQVNFPRKFNLNKKDGAFVCIDNLYNPGSIMLLFDYVC